MAMLMLYLMQPTSLQLYGLENVTALLHSAWNDPSVMVGTWPLI